MYTFNIFNKKKKTIDIIPIICKSNNQAHKLRSRILASQPDLMSTSIIKLDSKKVRIWPEQ